MPKYSETHHLNVDDAGLASVHVAVHLQDADPRIARLLVLRVLDAAAAVADAPEQGILGQVVRPQTSGPCVHLDQADDKDPKEIQALGLACRHPSRVSQQEDEQPQEWECPHLDAPDILCSVRDTCYAMREVIRMRDSLDGDEGRLHTYVAEPEPEIPAPAPEEEPVYKTRKGAPLANMWAPAECAAIAGAGTRQEALAGYRAAFPDSDRTDGAVMRQWYAVRSAPVTATDDRRGTWMPEEEAILLKAKTLAAAVKTYRAKFGDDKRTYAALSSRFYRVRKNQVEPTPDFVGDEVPVTQCEELDPDEVDLDQMAAGAVPSQGIYGGDRRAYEADLMDGMLCDRPLSEGTLAVGDRVVHQNGPPGVGEVLFVGKSGRNVSVQFPGSGVSHVYEVAELQRVEE